MTACLKCCKKKNHVASVCLRSFFFSSLLLQKPQLLVFENHAIKGPFSHQTRAKKKGSKERDIGSARCAAPTMECVDLSIYKRRAARPAATKVARPSGRHSPSYTRAATCIHIFIYHASDSVPCITIRFLFS